MNRPTFGTPASTRDATEFRNCVRSDDGIPSFSVIFGGEAGLPSRQLLGSRSKRLAAATPAAGSHVFGSRGANR
jgi:hypothetical protein